MGKKIRYLTSNEKCIYLPLWSFTRYRNKSLRPPLFSDVLPCFRKWNSEPLFIKLFTFASGPSEIQKLFLQYVMYRFTRLGEARRERAPQTVVLIVFTTFSAFSELVRPRMGTSPIMSHTVSTPDTASSTIASSTNKWSIHWRNASQRIFSIWYVYFEGTSK